MPWLIVSYLSPYYLGCAVIQGITEAFPISSSFHFLLFSQWMDVSVAPSKALSAGLHTGSFLALCLIFRHDVVALFRGFFQYFKTKTSPLDRLSPANLFKPIGQDIFFVNSMMVAGLGLIMGTGLVYGLKYAFFSTFTLSLRAMAGVYIVFALVMEWANRWQKNRFDQNPRCFSYQDSFWIGLSQVLAMVCSGVSRLGITITTGRLLGHSLATATRYSLILGMPVLASSILVSLPEIVKGSLSAELFLKMTLVTFLCSWPMFHVMLILARRESTMPFTLYRIFIGAIVVFTETKIWGL